MQKSQRQKKTKRFFSTRQCRDFKKITSTKKYRILEFINHFQSLFNVIPEPKSKMKIISTYYSKRFFLCLSKEKGFYKML